MSLIDPTNVVNNLIALAAIGMIVFMIWSKMDREKTRQTIESFKKLFGGKKE